MKEYETRKTKSKVECLKLEKLQSLVVSGLGEFFLPPALWVCGRWETFRETRLAASIAFWGWGLGAHPLYVYTFTARPQCRVSDYEKWVPI